MKSIVRPTTRVPEKTLIVSSMGVVLSPVEYQLCNLSNRDEDSSPLKENVKACCGASAVQAYLSGSDEVDVLIFTTNATDPSKDDAETEKKGWSEGDRALFTHSALQRVEQDLYAVRKELGLEGTLNIDSLRTLWEQTSGEKLVDEIVGFPARLEGVIREKFDKKWEDYKQIFIDVAAGLRPLGTGLWLTVAYLMEARGLARRTTAFYVELKQASKPVFFPASLDNDKKKFPAKDRSSAQGRLIDLTPFFFSLSATVAVSHLARSLDFREVMRLIESAAGKEISFPENFEAFASAAQLGLDLEAVALAHTLRWPEQQKNASGREALAEHLMGEVVTVGRSWAQFHEGRDLPTFKLKKGKFKLRKKESWPLDAREIWREANLVQQFLDHGRLADASLHLREMVISALQMVFLPDSSSRKKWLTNRHKDDARLLGTLAYLGRNPRFRERARAAGAEEAKALVERVGALTELRNPLAHAGRSERSDDPVQIKQAIEKLWHYFRPPVPAADKLTEAAEVEFQNWLEGWPTLALRLIGQDSRSEARGFINLSNHPLQRWSQAQISAAQNLGFGPLEDWPGGFPRVDPQATSEEVAHMASELTTQILERNPGAVHVAGELVMVNALVRKLAGAGVPCFAATSERVASERLQSDGSVERIAEFRFVMWRKYV